MNEPDPSVTLGDVQALVERALRLRRPRRSTPWILEPCTSRARGPSWARSPGICALAVRATTSSHRDRELAADAETMPIKVTVAGSVLNAGH